MSLKYKRFEPTPEGNTLLLAAGRKVWKDPSKPENAPLPRLESEKGIMIPSWGQCLTGLGVLCSIVTLYQRRLKVRW